MVVTIGWEAPARASGRLVVGPAAWVVSRGPSSTSRPRTRGDAPGQKRRLGRVVDGLLDRVDHALRLLAGLALALAARRLGVDELARARDLEVARRARVADLLDGYVVAELLLDRLS